MITASVSETRRKLGELIELARKGEDVVIIKDSRPVATLQPIDASDMELVTRVSNRQAQHLREMIDSERRQTFRSAAAAVKFLKKEMSRKH
jgi:prevent-host-death family protein